jgi:hypothetical protein
MNIYSLLLNAYINKYDNEISSVQELNYNKNIRQYIWANNPNQLAMLRRLDKNRK